MDINVVLIYIRKEIEKIRKENHMAIIVKDSIFDVLNKKCTVIYYPLPDEKNRGFHIKKLVGDKLEDFVYINTDKTVEQQVFTAAHEMGHVCNVFKDIALLAELDGLEVDLDDEDFEEKVTDRFAAELLMPETEFKQKTHKYLNSIGAEDYVLLPDLMKIIAELMDDFLAPFNAVRKRLYEIGAISDSVDNYLRENKIKLEKYIDVIKKDENSLINSKTSIRMIPGLRDLINDASSRADVDKGLIEKIKADFAVEDIDDLGEKINIKIPRK